MRTGCASKALDGPWATEVNLCAVGFRGLGSMSLVVRASADGLGVELPFETVCKCFDVLSAPDADRQGVQ